MPPEVAAASGPPPDLSVSVVTYRSLDCLEALFASFARQTGVRWELFVVDNASQDGTAEWLAANAEAEITINPDNVGYGRAHNQNLAAFRGRHVLLLNPDLEFEDGVFSSLVRFLDEHPGYAAVGPAVVEGPERKPFPPRRFYPGERAVALETGLPRDEVAWLSGCALALRREDLLRLGGFDPDFFLYHEETDLCLRARRAGAKIGWCGNTEVFHSRHQSQQHLSGYERQLNLLRGTLRFWEKHYAESDVATIARFRWLVASLRLGVATLGLRVSDTARDYLRAERDVCHAWLEDHPSSLVTAASAPLRVFGRYLHLALDRARTGRFPIDAV